MGITLKDIHNQREMLRRGEEIARAAEEAAERERLRDAFAAAALTGLLVHANDGIDEDTLDTPSDIAYAAYQIADAMIRERSRAVQKIAECDSSRAVCTTNHDAAPAAKARTDADSDRTDKAASRPGAGTGDTPAVTEPMPEAPSGSGSVTPDPYSRTDENRVDSLTKRDTTQPPNGALREPIAFGIFSDGECYSAFDTQADADERADMLTTADPDREFNVIPLYAECPHCFVDATPQPNATPPQDSVQGEGTEPVAWAVVCGDCVDSLFTDRDEAVEWAYGIIPPPHIVPLYRHPPCQDFSQKNLTLTDAEREAIENCVYASERIGDDWSDRQAATLRGLLERTK